jgi:tripartite-type tricarboxylate transporter receptor subunit TctC
LLSKAAECILKAETEITSVSDSQRRASVVAAAIRAVAAALVAVPFLIAATAGNAQTKVALVIGNNAYLRVPPLNNAVNDASAVADELNRLGFKVIRLLDGKIGDINEAQQLYLKDVANGGIGVVYFAGHGVQVEGRNFLLPVDFSASTADGLAKGALSVPNLLDAVDRAKARLSIVILDACRDNPFAAAPQAPKTRGLSEVARPVPSGTLVLYAASSNQTALDALPNQRAKNGLFTGELLSLLKEPGLEIRDLAQKVRFNVMEKARAAGHLQVPALYDNLSFGSFYLAQPPRAPSPVPAAAGGLPQQIRIIVPFAAKGPSDSVVRSMVPFLAKELGREIVVENDIDVEGGRVTASVGGSAKDGSVLMVSSFTPSARRFEVNDQRVTPLGIFADTPLGVFVNVRHPATNLSQLLETTRAARQKLRMTVPLRGSPAEMCGQQLQRKFGADVIELVAVNGEAVAVAEVSKGNADLTCASAAAVRGSASQPNSPLREIAEIRATASPVARQIQVTAASSQGFDIVAPNWLGLFAPGGVSPDLIRQLSAAMAKVQADPAYAQSIARLAALPVSAEQATPNGLLRVLRLALALQLN